MRACMQASDVLDKLDQYGTVFAEDFAGTNGRSRKTLWLTEVAAATSDIAVLVPFVNSLMSTSACVRAYSLVSFRCWLCASYRACVCDALCCLHCHTHA
jgi:hypothetical protein